MFICKSVCLSVKWNDNKKIDSIDNYAIYDYTSII